MNRFAVMAGIWLVSLFFLGCEGKIITEAEIDENGGPIGGNPGTFFTFTQVQNQIFTPSCATAGCHTGINPQSGLDLSAGVAYDRIVNVNSLGMPNLKLINPGDSDNSYLIRKLRGTGIKDARMPNGRPPLAPAVIDSIASWVDRGAARD